MTFFDTEHEIAWAIAGVFCLISASITCYQTYMHLKYNSYPPLRKYVIRIIWMVPIYALESWLGLRFYRIGLYFDLLREVYESFVIYSFYQLLVTYLGGEEQLVALLGTKKEIPHMMPFCFLPKWRMTDRFMVERGVRMDEMKEGERINLGDSERLPTIVHEGAAEHAATNASTTTNNDPSASNSTDSSTTSTPAHVPDYSSIRTLYLTPTSRPHHSDFLTHTQLGTLQYCVCKPMTAVLALLLSWLDLYGESSFDFSRGYPYLAFITNMSQIWAMYCLVLFYMVCKDDLKELKPIPKFLCVKAVVFFTFWQSVLIAILAWADVVHATTRFTAEEMVTAIQNFIVCTEMLVAALAHHFAFSWKDFHDPTLPPTTDFAPGLLQALNVTDVYVSDIRHITMKSIRIKSKKKKKGHVQQADVLVLEETFVNIRGPELQQPLNDADALSEDDIITYRDGSPVSQSQHLQQPQQTYQPPTPSLPLDPNQQTVQ